MGFEFYQKYKSGIFFESEKIIIKYSLEFFLFFIQFGNTTYQRKYYYVENLLIYVNTFSRKVPQLSI